MTPLDLFYLAIERSDSPSIYGRNAGVWLRRYNEGMEGTFVVYPREHFVLSAYEDLDDLLATLDLLWLRGRFETARLSRSFSIRYEDAVDLVWAYFGENAIAAWRERLVSFR